MSDKLLPTNSSVIDGCIKKKMLSRFMLYGFTLKYDSFKLLENEYLNSYPPYDCLKSFIHQVLDIIINKIPSDSSFIDNEFAEKIIDNLHKIKRKNYSIVLHDLVVKNINYKEKDLKETHQLHVKYLNSICDKFINDLDKQISNNTFEIRKLSSVINTYRSTLNCNVFGFIKKNLQKLNEYIFEDDTGSVIVEFTNDTEFKNSIILENSFLLIDGLFHSLANVLYVNKIGYLPPKITLNFSSFDKEEIQNSVNNLKSNMFVILREVFLDERCVLEKLKLLFTAYNSVNPNPHFFILIGPFSREDVTEDVLEDLFKFFFKIILTCDNISKNSKFIFVPSVNKCETNFLKPPIFLDYEKFSYTNLNLNFATNPTNLYVNDKHICIFSSNYFENVKKCIINKNRLFDYDFYNEYANIIISNSFLAPGLYKYYNNSMNLFHIPNLIIFCDNSLQKEIEFKLLDRIFFINLRSFSLDNFKFKVFYSDSEILEDSQINI